MENVLYLIERKLEESGINCINEDFIILNPHWVLLFLSNEGIVNGRAGSVDGVY